MGVSIFALDATVRKSDFTLKGVIASVGIDNAEARSADNIASELFGAYGELGWHCMPENWKNGKLIDSDLILFGRYELYDTQHKVPTGAVKDPKNDRTTTTLGITFLPLSNVALKADYQIMENASSVKPPNQWNLGIGWLF